MASRLWITDVSKELLEIFRGSSNSGITVGCIWFYAVR